MESPVATSIQASRPTKPMEAEDSQIGQNWLDGIGPATQGLTLEGVLSGHQERSVIDHYRFHTAHIRYSVDDSTTRAAVNRAQPANEIPAEISPLEPSIVLAELCVTTIHCAARFSSREQLSRSEAPQSEPSIKDKDNKRAGASMPAVIITTSKPIEFNQTVYYKNKTEFGLDIGWLPVNIPFVFDIFLGDGYNNPPLYYTLIPIVASLRWHMNDVGGPWIFRGNWDLQTSLGIVPIPRGPETHYFAWIMGLRRNFVPRRGKIAPYFDFRLGLGRIDAKEPSGVLFAQGQDFTFTMNLGSGVRYNFNQKYSISAGINWMHISNAYLSEPRYPDYGINVYGPMFGIDVRLGKPHRDRSQ